VSDAALPSRDAIVATAQESIARGSKSFAAASTLFDRRTRERAWLLYAWCRACDDIADGQDHGHGMTLIHDAPERLVRITALTEAALAGQVVGDPAFDALRIVAAETRMPHAFARDLIAGFALDARDWRPRSEADLYKYCYHVAGVVGCMMAVAMGVDPDDQDTLDRACDLGMAFQLANIARDIEEDDRVGRAYVPEDWFVEMDIPPGQHMKPPFRPRLAVLARRMADRAAAFEASARVGTPKLSFRSGRTRVGHPRDDIGLAEAEVHRAGGDRGTRASGALSADAARHRLDAAAALILSPSPSPAQAGAQSRR
jgi:phytoene synthase